jgi:predicted nicotinamide N-methyase
VESRCPDCDTVALVKHESGSSEWIFDSDLSAREKAGCISLGEQYPQDRPPNFGQSTRLALDCLGALLWTGEYDHSICMWKREWVVAAEGTPTLTLFEDTAIDGKDGEHQLWPAGLILARFLESAEWGPARLRGKTVVELGAGAGLGAMTAAALGAHAAATEQANVMPYLMACVETNAAVAPCSAVVLDWGAASTGVLKDMTPCMVPADVVLVADCTYNSAMYPILLEAMVSITGPGSTVILAHDQASVPVRNNMAKQFVHGTAAEYFDAVEIDVPETLPSRWRSLTVQLYVLTRR